MNGESGLPDDHPKPLFQLEEGDRRRLALVVMGILVSVLALRISQLLDLAWTSRGVGFEFVVMVTNGNFDSMVVGPAGLLTGWILLFMLDRTKRLQKVFVGLAVVVFVVWNVMVGDRWVEHVAWGDRWLLWILMFVVAVAVAVVPQTRSGRRQWEYPFAASGLFLFAATLCIVGFFDVYWFAADRASAEAASVGGLAPGTLSAVLIDGVVVLGFISLLGKFMMYNDVRTVAFVNSSEDAAMATLVGLFHHVEGEYRGRGPDCLKDGFIPLEAGETPSPNLCGPGRIEFTYLPSGVFPQWVTVAADPISIEDLDDVELRTVSKAGSQSRVARIGSSLVGSITPGFVQHVLQPERQQLASRTVNADVLVFVATSDSAITRFEEVCDYLPNHTDKLVIDPGTASPGRLPPEYQIIEVDWPGNQIPLVTGIGELRRRLDA